MKPLIEHEFKMITTKQLRGDGTFIVVPRKILFVKANYEAIEWMGQFSKEIHLKEIKDPQWQQVPEALEEFRL